MSKYFVSVSRTSSESRPSANGVKPTRSANSTVTSFRSDPGSLAGATIVGRIAGIICCDPRGASDVAHSRQNLAPGLFNVPQLGQPEASGDAHSSQNFAPWMFCVPQLGQTNPKTPLGRKQLTSTRRIPARAANITHAYLAVVLDMAL